MKVLVTGGSGMLGRDAAAEFASRGHDVIALDKAALDVTRPGDVAEAVDRYAPEVVVQCAAYTQVDAAEQIPETAWEVNARGASVVARECQRVGALFVYPSTDYVFSGASQSPWKTTDSPNPLNAYGKSKLEGEQEALRGDRGLVVRTSWLYGDGGPNFVEKICQAARERGRLEVVDDQIGRPTWTRSFAVSLAGLVEADASGIFHASDGGDPVSWYEFAQEILRLRGIDVPLIPVASSEYPRPARRPSYSVLDCTETERVLGCSMKDWRLSLDQYLGKIACV
jgi:dTDP-4-dehydrorhamnose reductase